MTEKLEMVVERIEAGDAIRDTDEVVEPLTIRQSLDKVVPVRLSAEQWTQLRAAAGKIGVGPSTLVRMWALEKLREEGSGP